jgi:hypothetical protein
MTNEASLSERLRAAFDASGRPDVAPAATNAATPRRRRTPDAVQEARGIVIDLIEWEINAADGERMAAAAERHGWDVIVRALHAIANDLRRKGAAP